MQYQWVEDDGDVPLDRHSDSDTSMEEEYELVQDDGDVRGGLTLKVLSNPNDRRKYVMYHGTTRQAAQDIMKNGFRRSSGGMLGPGVYLSSQLKKASRYPLKCPEGNRVVIKAKVRVGKVIAINKKHHPRQYTWHDDDEYDTAWVPRNCGMVPSGLEESCVWDPERIEIIDIINPLPVSARGISEHQGV